MRVTSTMGCILCHANVLQADGGGVSVDVRHREAKNRMNCSAYRMSSDMKVRHRLGRHG